MVSGRFGSLGSYSLPRHRRKNSISGLAVFKFSNGLIVDEPWSNWNLSDRDQQGAQALVQRQVAAACVRKYVAGFWEGDDAESSERFLSPDVKITTPWSDKVITGPKAFGEWISSFRASNPDFEYQSTVHTNHDSGDTVFRTWSAKNVDGDSTGVAMTRFENGLIVEDRICS